MNTPNDNPYPGPAPTTANKANVDKGSILAGFFIGWGLMIGGGILTGIIASFLSMVIGYNNSFLPFLSMCAFLIPIIILIAGMVWFGKNGKSKTVKGIVAAIISLIALVLLLVAACFGIFAMNGSGFH